MWLYQTGLMSWPSDRDPMAKSAYPFTRCIVTIGFNLDGSRLRTGSQGCDLIWTLRSKSNGPELSIPLRPGDLSKEPLSLIQINPQSEQWEIES
jgi:hypothetical protein